MNTTLPSNNPLLLLSLAGLLLASPAFAQTPADRPALGGGRALDANTKVGGDGRNQQSQDINALIRFNDAVITGQAAGGKSFRGPLGYRSASDFRGPLSTDSTYRFERDSALSGLSSTGLRSSDLLSQQFALSSGRTNPSYDPRISSALTPSRSNVSSGDSLRSLRSIADYETAQARRPTVLGITADEATGTRQALTASRLTGLRTQRIDDRATDTLRRTSNTSSSNLTDSRPINPANLTETARAAAPSSADLNSNRLTTPTPERSAAALAPSAPNAGGTSPARTAYSDIADRFRTAAGSADLRRPEALRPARTGPEERDPRAAREPRPTRSDLESGTSSANRNNLNAPLKGEDAAQTELRLLRQRLAGLRSDADRQAAQPIDPAPRLRLDLVGTPTRFVDPSKPAPLPGEEFLPRNRTPEQAPPRARTAWDVYADQQLTKALQSMRQGDRLKSLLSADAEKNLPDYAKLMTDAATALSAGRYFDAETLYTRAMFINPDPVSATAGDVMARVGRVHAQLGAGLTMSSATALRALFIDHPEMLPVRYDPAIILPAKRAEALAQELSLEMGKGMTALADESAYLLAYLGFQFDNQAWLDEGLKRMKLRASDMDLARAEQALAARRIWGNEKTEPDQPRPADAAPAPTPAPDTNK